MKPFSAAPEASQLQSDPIAKAATSDTVAALHIAAITGDINAISELGTVYRFGRGVERRIRVAAEFHVIAALDGDATAIASLAEYRDEIEAEAIGGSLLAALCLAKMHDRGLGVEQNKAKMFAWLLWGERCGTLENEFDVREELEDMRSFYALTLSDDTKDEACALSNRMRAAAPRAVMA